MLEKLPYQQSLVVSLDEFGGQVAAEARRLIDQFDAGIRREMVAEAGPYAQPFGDSIGWHAAERDEAGTWQALSPDGSARIGPLADALGATAAGLSSTWSTVIDVPQAREPAHPVFILRALESPEDAESLSEVGRLWRDYLTLHPHIFSSRVYAYCFAPSHPGTTDRALIERRSRAVTLLAQQIADGTSCDHAIFFEDLRKSGGVVPREEVVSRLAMGLFLLLTTRSLAEWYDRHLLSLDARDEGRVFSSISTYSLVFPAVPAAERASLALALEYVDHWLLPAENTSDGLRLVDDAAEELPALTDSRNGKERHWQERVYRSSQGRFLATPDTDTADAEPCLNLDVLAHFGVASDEQIKAILDPDDDPTRWAEQLHETDVALEMTWPHAFRQVTDEVFDGARGQPGLVAETEGRLSALANGLLSRENGPPSALAGVRDFLHQTERRSQLQRRSLERHNERRNHPQINLQRAHDDLKTATDGLPTRDALHARRIVGTVLAAVFLMAALFVHSLPACPGSFDVRWRWLSGREADELVTAAAGDPTQACSLLWTRLYPNDTVSRIISPLFLGTWPWSDLPGWSFGMMCLYVCFPHRELVRNALGILALLILVGTWLGLWVWDQDLKRRTERAWHRYWDGIKNKYRYLLHDIVVGRAIGLLERLERHTIPRLRAQTERLETDLAAVRDTARQRYAGLTLDPVESSQVALSVLDDRLYETLVRTRVYTHDPERTLRGLASGRDLVAAEGLATPAGLDPAGHLPDPAAPDSLWGRLHATRSRDYVADQLLRISIRQLLADDGPAILSRVLARLPESQQDYPHLVQTMRRFAPPLTSVIDARESQTRLGQPLAYLLFSGTDQLTALREADSGLTTDEIADPFRVTVVHLTEPFSVRGLASVLALPAAQTPRPGDPAQTPRPDHLAQTPRPADDLAQTPRQDGYLDSPVSAGE